MSKSNLRKPLHIAVVAPSSPNDFFGLIWKGVWSAACELAPFGVRIDSYETSGHDLTAQRRILANLRDNPPAALALVPAHVSDLNPQLAQLADLQIPIVTFHADAPASARKFYVGTDPDHSGALAGDVLALLMHGTGTVASFPGSLETEHFKQRYLGFRRQLKLRAPDIRESYSHSGFNGLAESVERALENNKELSGLYVGCSQAHTVGRILSQSGLNIPCVAFDMTDLTRPFLASGVLSAMIDEDVYHQGYLAIQFAYEAVYSENPCLPIPLQASVVLGLNASRPETPDFGSGIFEQLVRMRTHRTVRAQELLAETSSRLLVLSETDPLTGLLNRAKFEELLSSRVRDRERLSIVTISLEGFEHTASQALNEEALKAVAKVLRIFAGPQDECARIGSNEFCVLMPGAGLSKAASARERILQAISKTIIAPQTLRLPIQASLGTASLPEDATSAEDLIVHADNAMCAHRRASILANQTGVPRPRRANDIFDTRPARLPA